MHNSQVQYCLEVKNKFPFYFKNKKVIDFGSMNINGDNTFLFEDCYYVGVDVGPGKNVHIVGKAHEIRHLDETYDTVISTEMFEHDMYLHLSIPNMIRVLKSNGLFLFTCAGPGREEHGTRRTQPFASPHTSTMEHWCDYYANVDENKIREIIDVDGIFKQYEFRSIEGDWKIPNADLQFYGIKK